MLELGKRIAYEFKNEICVCRIYVHVEYDIRDHVYIHVATKALNQLVGRFYITIFNVISWQYA